MLMQLLLIDFICCANVNLVLAAKASSEIPTDRPVVIAMPVSFSAACL